MFDKVITDPDWRAALHGKPVMQVNYEGETFTSVRQKRFTLCGNLRGEVITLSILP